MPNREKITDSANKRAIDKPIAGTPQGRPDGGLSPAEDLPEERSDEDVAWVAAKLGAPDQTKNFLGLR
ncbi:hypothetical protein [Sphingomonas sp. CFBP 13706]|uniref:hypothetical protein n=1 Tax=Sphingomonas sp. CFBP 13706 TaxID=2775314 RepID=UPI00177B1A50|nr:hypothetical protein [Sphingomonas sp. CFBP 13706]MBD8734508.1 hypothetical protein [Sphingomonas sp. CFBP 13706]